MMGRPPAASAAPGIPPAAAACLLLLACLAALLAVSEQRPRSPNATEAHGGLWKGHSEQTPPNREPPKKEVAAKNGLFNASSGSVAEEAWLPVDSVAAAAVAAAAATAAAGGAKESQLKPPAAVQSLSSGGGGGGGGGTDPATASSPPGASTISLRYLPREADEEQKETAWKARQSSQWEGTGPSEARAELTRFARPFPDGAWKVLDGQEGAGSLPPGPESQREAGSGDQQAGVSAGEEDLSGGTTILPPLPEATEVSLLSSRGFGRSSVGTELLLDPLGGKVSAPPTERPGPPQQPRGVPDQDSAQKEEPLELWVDASSHSPAEGPQGHTDLTWLEAVTPPLPATQTPKPSPDPLASEIIDIDYYDLFDGEGLGREPGLDATKGKPSSEDKGMSWSLHDLYDDFTPFDESDFYPTTSFYTDGDDEDLEEPEEEEEEEEEDDEEDEGGGLARDLEDENNYRMPTLATPQIQTVAQEAEPTTRLHLIPPLETFVVSGGSGLATPRPRPAEAGRDLSLSGAGSENATECRSGYIRHNTSCKSICDTFPSYCHNGGQCYLVEHLGAFCRCNTQDYIWHKGIRCESIITDFQVMCVAVGSAALVVLLLFMMTVFFAKKLYLLKTENKKLRKTKYRTPSELHNDNFSLSTIAEGSHPNDDPSAPHKLQDSLKSCLKEEESFNIQNSMSPKLENSKGDPDAADVNCLQNNLT